MMEFIAIITILLVLVFLSLKYLFKNKNEDIKYLNQNKCPHCKNTLLDEDVHSRNFCSSGTKMITITCSQCGFRETYNVPNNGSCGI